MTARFLILYTIAIVACGSFGTTQAIVGGSNTSVSNFPYLVSIRHKSCDSCAFEHFASGVIYSRNIIITTASSMITKVLKSLIVVTSTSYRSGADGLVFPVESIFIHENFKYINMDNDIALLKLRVDIPLRQLLDVKALKIAQVNPSVGSVAVVAGWGQTAEDGDFSETLQNTKVPIVSWETCQKAYQFSEITASMVCAGFEEGGHDACKGDTGSPLVVRNELVGLVSWGVGCARPNHPGVYTYVVQLRRWVDTIVQTN